MPTAPLPASAQPPLRIAVVTETYPPEVNGVSLSLAQLVDGLRGRGHRVLLARPRQPHEAPGPADARVPPDTLLMRGLPIPRYPQLRLGLPAQGALMAHWQQRRPQVVHIATEGPLGWSALQAAQALGLPVTSDFRTHFEAYSQHYGIGWLRRPIQAYLRHFHNRGVTTLVPTTALRDALQQQGFERLQVVGRGVDTERFSPARRSDALRAAWGVGPGTLVVACVGRLAAEKNLGLLMSAFEALQARVPDSRLLLVGDGPERASLQARCPNALLVGNRNGLDLAEHYASADLFLFPSLTETFGNVTPEALASGLPVLAFARAAAAQLIQPGLNGLLAPVDDPASFVHQAMDLAQDRPAAQALGQRARQAMLTHGWGPIVAQVESCLRHAAMQTAALPAGALPAALPSPH